MRVIELDMLSAIQKWKRWKNKNTKFIPDADRNYGVVCLYDQVIAHIDPKEKKPTWGTMRSWDTQTTKSRLRALGILDQVLALKGAPYDPHQTFLSGMQIRLDFPEPEIQLNKVPEKIISSTAEFPRTRITYRDYVPGRSTGVNLLDLVGDDLNQVRRDINFVPTRGPLTDEEAEEALRRVLDGVRTEFAFNPDSQEVRRQVQQATQDYLDNLTGTTQERYSVDVQGGGSQLVVNLNITPGQFSDSFTRWTPEDLDF